jgi:hypothetical protein
MEEGMAEFWSIIIFMNTIYGMRPPRRASAFHRVPARENAAMMDRPGGQGAEAVLARRITGADAMFCFGRAGA